MFYPKLITHIHTHWSLCVSVLKWFWIRVWLNNWLKPGDSWIKMILKLSGKQQILQLTYYIIIWNICLLVCFVCRLVDLYSLNLSIFFRRGHDVLRTQLPTKEEHVILVRLSPLQRALYKEFMNRFREAGNNGWLGLNPLKAFCVCCKVTTPEISVLINQIPSS